MEKLADISDSEAEVGEFSTPQGLQSQSSCVYTNRCSLECDSRILNLETRVRDLEKYIYANPNESTGKITSDLDDSMMLPVSNDKVIKNWDMHDMHTSKQQNPYNEEDRRLIVKYLIDNDLQGSTGVNSGTWHRMAKDVKFSFRRTHQSLENHFRKVIRPNLRNFVHCEGDRKKFDSVDSPRKRKREIVILD